MSATMNQKIASALNAFINMNKSDQQDYLNTLLDYVIARRDEKAETTEMMRGAMNEPSLVAKV